MAEPNYSTSNDQYVDEESIDCGTTSQSSLTLFPSAHNAMPNDFDQYFSTAQNFPYSHHLSPEYGDLSMTFAERYLNFDDVTSPSPTSYNLMDSSTSTSNRNTHIRSNEIYSQTLRSERDFCIDLENDSRNSVNSSTYTENNFPPYFHTNYSSPSQPELVEQTPSSFNILNWDSQNLSPDVDRQCILPPKLPPTLSPIHTFRMLPMSSLYKYPYANCSASISPFLGTSPSPLKSESLLPPPTDKAQGPTSKLLLPPLIDKAQVKVGTRAYWCTACNMGFSRKSDLKRHYKTKKHINVVIVSGKPDPAGTSSIQTNLTIVPRPYNCTTCNKAFVNKDHLKTHFKAAAHKIEVEISGKPDPATFGIDLKKFEFYCKPCNRFFASSNYFKRHNNFRHNGEKPY